MTDPQETTETIVHCVCGYAWVRGSGEVCGECGGPCSPQEIAAGLDEGHRAVITCTAKGYFDKTAKHLPAAYPYLHILGLIDCDGLTLLGREVAAIIKEQNNGT